MRTNPLLILFFSSALCGRVLWSAAVLADEPKPMAAPSVLPTVAGHPATPLQLADFEQMALNGNPTLRQAAAQVDASRGKALQAGLYPNPVIGYTGDLMGAQGTAGELQGGFVEQTIVTAGKLRLSRAKYKQESYEAELMALAQQYRVLNSVRVHYFELLGLQRMIELRRNIQANAEEGLRTHREMVNNGQASRPDLLLAEIGLNDARMDLLTRENQYTAQWRELASLVGCPELPSTTLQGRLEPEGLPLSWDSSLGRLLEESPELQAAQAHVVHDQIAVQRERVEPVPDLRLRGASGYDFETNNAVASVEIAVRLPLWDRNQGTIQQARADLARSQSEVTRVELSLRQRLAAAFNRYETALRVSQMYRDGSLPKAAEAYDIQLDMYKKRRIAWPQVVELQRVVLDLNEKYTRSLLELRESEVAIRGLLLVDGLSAPASPTPAGHIESTPKPR